MFVDVLDVAEAIATVAMQVDGKFEGKTVDVVGPSEMDVRSFLDVVSAGARLRTTYAIPFPSWVLKRAAAAMEQLMDRPAITQAQLHLLSTGVVGDVEQTTSLLGRAPRRLTEERVRRIVERSPPEPLFGVSFRPVWHPQHFSYLEPYARAHRSLLFALPLGLTLGVVGPFFMTQGQVAACLAAISAPATLPTLHWLLLPGPLTLVYGTTSALGVSIFCHKGPPYFGFGLINQMHSGVLGKISLGWGSRYILGHTRTWEEDWPVLLLVTFAEELWRARIALPIAANSRPELGVLLSAVFFILCGAPHGTAVHAGVAGLILGFLTVRTQGILAPFITRYLGIALYIGAGGVAAVAAVAAAAPPCRHAFSACSLSLFALFRRVRTIPIGRFVSLWRLGIAWLISSEAFCAFPISVLRFLSRYKYGMMLLYAIRKCVLRMRLIRLYWIFYTWTEKTEKPVQDDVARGLLNAWLPPATQLPPTWSS
eukprot:7377186-Prymnesium_polylepis.1